MREIPRRKLMLATVLAGCALSLGVPGEAVAQPAVTHPSAEVLVLHGTTCAQPIVDPQIGEIPPLKHNCWKVLDKRTLALTGGTPSLMPLANGRTFQVAYNGATTEKPARFKVTASISKPDGVGFNQLADFTAEPGKKFHVGGFAYQNGSLVLAIRILP